MNLIYYIVTLFKYKIFKKKIFFSYFYYLFFIYKPFFIYFILKRFKKIDEKTFSFYIIITTFYCF